MDLLDDGFDDAPMLDLGAINIEYFQEAEWPEEIDVSDEAGEGSDEQRNKN